MLRTIARWIPTVLLVLVLATGLTSGAGVEPVAVVALVAIQILVIGLPKAAHQLGAWYGARGSADDGPEPAEG